MNSEIENINNSFEFLKFMTDKFDEWNIPYWLESGTLLGAYRHENFIENDNDIDIGVDVRYINDINLLLESLEIQDFIQIYHYMHQGVDVSDKIKKLSYKKHIDNCKWMDIYFFKKRGNIYENCLFSDENNSKVKTPSSCIETLDKIKIKSFYFSCPSNPDTVLKLRYGKNYMIPQRRCEELDKEWWQIEDNVTDEFLNI